MNYDKIGEFIAKLRKEKGLTQKELASIIGVTDKAISKWENGLGCPDVSLLEDLSKALDVSILEILKGRNIKEEELQNENINELVLDTVNYSKGELNKKYKNIVLNILTIVIIVIVGFISILNIYHIKYLNQYEEINFSNSTVLTQSKEKLKTIKDNIELIKNNINKLSSNEIIINSVPKKLEEMYNILIKYPILNYKGKHKFYIKDIVLLDTNFLSVFDLIEIYSDLSQENPELTRYYELYRNNAINEIYKGAAMYQKVNKYYQYTLIFNEPDETINNQYNINSRIINLSSYIENLYFFN